MFPRKFVFLITFVSMLLLCIPIYYGVSYATNKVDVFKEEIAEINTKIEAYKNDPKSNDEYTFKKMSAKEFNDNVFEIAIETPKFDVTSSYSANVKVRISKEKLKGGDIIGRINFNMALAANWIKFYKTSSGSIDSSYLYKESEYNDTSFYFDGLQPLVTHDKPLLPLPKPTAYLLVEYIFQPDGTNKEIHHNVLLKYKYSQMNVGNGTGYPA